jgi:hypothetical protein
MAATTILTVLSSIPWRQVVENAPKVANGAMKLWKAVVNRRKATAPGAAPAGATIAGELPETDALKARLVALEESVRILQDQMQSSSELIKTLAEQDAQLVNRIELNRKRLMRLAVAVCIGGAGMLTAILYLLLRT